MPIPIALSGRHGGVTCDVCKAHDFKGLRFKCLLCFDFDVCEKCYKKPVFGIGQHSLNHALQAIVAPTDYPKFYAGEEFDASKPLSLTCPYCNKLGYSVASFMGHLTKVHEKPALGSRVLCPLCCSSLEGEMNMFYSNLTTHFRSRHADQIANSATIRVASPHAVAMYNRRMAQIRKINRELGLLLTPASPASSTAARGSASRPRDDSVAGFNHPGPEATVTSSAMVDNATRGMTLGGYALSPQRGEHDHDRPIVGPVSYRREIRTDPGRLSPPNAGAEPSATQHRRNLEQQRTLLSPSLPSWAKNAFTAADVVESESANEVIDDDSAQSTALDTANSGSGLLGPHPATSHGGAFEQAGSVVEAMLSVAYMEDSRDSVPTERDESICGCDGAVGMVGGFVFPVQMASINSSFDAASALTPRSTRTMITYPEDVPSPLATSTPTASTGPSPGDGSSQCEAVEDSNDEATTRRLMAQHREAVNFRDELVKELRRQKKPMEQMNVEMAIDVQPVSVDNFNRPSRGSRKRDFPEENEDKDATCDHHEREDPRLMSNRILKAREERATVNGEESLLRSLFVQELILGGLLAGNDAVEQLVDLSAKACDSKIEN